METNTIHNIFKFLRDKEGRELPLKFKILVEPESLTDEEYEQVLTTNNGGIVSRARLINLRGGTDYSVVYPFGSFEDINLSVAKWYKNGEVTYSLIDKQGRIITDRPESKFFEKMTIEKRTNKDWGNNGGSEHMITSYYNYTYGKNYDYVYHFGDEGDTNIATATIKDKNDKNIWVFINKKGQLDPGNYQNSENYSNKERAKKTLELMNNIR